MKSDSSLVNTPGTEAGATNNAGSSDGDVDFSDPAWQLPPLVCHHYVRVGAPPGSDAERLEDTKTAAAENTALE